MGNKKEPLKDLFYNMFDYIMILAIVLVVGSIIAWRLDILFADNSIDIEEDKNIQISKDNKENISKDTAKNLEAKRKEKTLNEQISRKEPMKNKKVKTNKNTKDIKNKEKINKDKKDKKEENKKENIEKVITIEIPDGSPSSVIAEIIKSEGLIKDEDEFIEKIEEMNVATKLRSGSYDIPEKSDLEAIIKILVK